MSGIHYRTSPRPNPRLLEPSRVGEHVWIAMACFRVAPETLRARPGGSIHMDQENLATIEIGCYVCEQPWSARLSWRDCPGHPVT